MWYHITRSIVDPAQRSIKPTAMTSIIAESAATGINCKSGAPYKSSSTSVTVVVMLDSNLRPPA